MSASHETKTIGDVTVLRLHDPALMKFDSIPAKSSRETPPPPGAKLAEETASSRLESPATTFFSWVISTFWLELIRPSAKPTHNTTAAATAHLVSAKISREARFLGMVGSFQSSNAAALDRHWVNCSRHAAHCAKCASNAFL